MDIIILCSFYIIRQLKYYKFINKKINRKHNSYNNKNSIKNQKNFKKVLPRKKI